MGRELLWGLKMSVAIQPALPARVEGVDRIYATESFRHNPSFIGTDLLDIK